MNAKHRPPAIYSKIKQKRMNRAKKFNEKRWKSERKKYIEINIENLSLIESCHRDEFFITALGKHSSQFLLGNLAPAQCQSVTLIVDF